MAKPLALKPLIVILFFILIGSVQAQIDDNIMWAAIKIQKNISNKTTLAAVPFLRMKEDISEYQNFSIDLIAKQKLTKGWAVQLLERTWFLPDNKYRQFFFLDVGYGKTINQLKMSSYVRGHYAIDINDRNDSDFLRWKAKLDLLGLKKVQPFLSFEPFFRLNHENEVQRIRYETGVLYKFNKSFNLLLGYRYETTPNVESVGNLNVLLVTVGYLLN